MTNSPYASLDWTPVDQRAVDLIRVLAMDSVQKVGNGHPGTGESVSLEHFGASAAYEDIYQHFGLTAEKVVAAARSSLAKAGRDTGAARAPAH